MNSERLSNITQMYQNSKINYLPHEIRRPLSQILNKLLQQIIQIDSSDLDQQAVENSLIEQLQYSRNRDESQDIEEIMELFRNSLQTADLSEIQKCLNLLEMIPTGIDQELKRTLMRSQSICRQAIISYNNQHPPTHHRSNQSVFDQQSFIHSQVNYSLKTKSNQQFNSSDFVNSYLSNSVSKKTPVKAQFNAQDYLNNCYTTKRGKKSQAPTQLNYQNTLTYSVGLNTYSTNFGGIMAKAKESTQEQDSMMDESSHEDYSNTQEFLERQLGQVSNNFY